MEKLKSNIQNMVAVLVVIALICGGLLAYVNQLTKPAIDAQAEKALADGIKAVLAADNVTVESSDTVKREIDGKEQAFVVYKTDKGTAVQSTDPNGFGGNLKVLVGFDAEGTILGYTVLEHAETPGLGAKAEGWFKGEGGDKANIVGKNPGKANFTVSKDGGDIDAITASTITSRSFLRAVQQAYNTYSGNSADANTGATKQQEGCCKEKAEGCSKEKAEEYGDCPHNAEACDHCKKNTNE